MKKLISLILALSMTVLCFPPVASAAGYGENLAIGKKIIASGGWGYGYDLEHINDGNPNSTAAVGDNIPADGPKDGLNTYVGVDLGDKYNISAVVVRTRRDMRDTWCRLINDVYIANREDFTDRVKIGEKKVAGEYGSDLVIEFDEPVTARFVFIGSGAGAYGELEVYGEQYIPVTEGVYYDVSEKYTNAVRVASDLGIMKGVKNGIFGSDNLVTRGEAAAIANNVLGISGSGYNGEFSDVPADHEYAEDIASALSFGLISKAEKFRPDDYITSYELFAILLRVSGFYSMSEDGAWYNDVLNLADHYGLSDGLDLSNNYINRGEVAMAVYNLLMGGYIEIDMNDKSYSMSENSFMKDKFHMELGEGIVTANPVTSLTADNIKGEGYIKIGDEEFVLDDPAKGDGLLGKAVYFLVNDDDELVDVWVNTKKTKQAELMTRDIELTSRTSIKTVIGNKNTTYKIDSNAYYLKNGVAFSNVDYSSMAPKYGSVRLIDNDRDNVYEVVEIREPEIVAVTSVSRNEDVKEISVSGKNNYKKTFNYEYAYSYSSAGVRGDLASVKAGKLVYLYASENGKYIEFYVHSGDAEGVVSQISEDKIVIDGDEYVVSEYFKDNYLSDVKLGGTYSFLLNDEGELMVVTDSSSRFVGEKLAIVTKCNEDTDDGKIYFKFYTEDNKFTEYVASDKCKVDDIKLNASTFNNLGKEYFIGKPVIIKVNGNSEVTSIVTPVSEKLKERNETINGAIAAKAGYFTGSTLVLPACQDTVSFRIPTDENGKLKTDDTYSSIYSVKMLDQRYSLNRDGITRDEKITLYGKDDNGLPIVALSAVQYPDLGGYGVISRFNNRISVIVDNVSRVLGSDGDIQYKISGWDSFTGANVSFTTEPELTSVVNTFKARNFDLYDKTSVPEEYWPKSDWYQDTIRWVPTKVNKYFLDPIESLERGDIIKYGVQDGRTSANELEVILKYDKLNDITTKIPYTAGDLPGTILSSCRIEYAHITECSDGRVKFSAPDGTSENLALSAFAGKLLVFDGKYCDKYNFSEAESYLGSGETVLIFTSEAIHQSIIVYK